MAKIVYKYTAADLKTMQDWSLERKIQVTQTRIIEWYQHYDGMAYVSFSGGKDSTVLLDLVRRIYPDVPAVFVDTGLEYPEIREFVKTVTNVITLRPAMSFQNVIKTYGYPVISKEVSKIIYGARHSKDKKQNYLNRLDGLNPDYTFSKYKQQYKKWKNLLETSFEISNRCCWYMKEKPLTAYERESGRQPMIATMAEDSQQRKDGWLKTGCNAFAENKRAVSKPMGFWTEQDVLWYLKRTSIGYASVYGNIVSVNSQTALFDDEAYKLKTTGASRTGCMFCMFGVHLEKEPNRFQRMKVTHPKLYDYCIHEIGCGKVLDYIGIRY